MGIKEIQGSKRQGKDWSVFHTVMERRASSLKPKEQTAPASAAIGEVGKVSLSSVKLMAKFLAINEEGFPN